MSTNIDMEAFKASVPNTLTVAGYEMFNTNSNWQLRPMEMATAFSTIGDTMELRDFRKKQLDEKDAKIEKYKRQQREAEETLRQVLEEKKLAPKIGYSDDKKRKEKIDQDRRMVALDEKKTARDREALERDEEDAEEIELTRRRAKNAIDRKFKELPVEKRRSVILDEKKTAEHRRMLAKDEEDDEEMDAIEYRRPKRAVKETPAEKRLREMEAEMNSLRAQLAKLNHESSDDEDDSLDSDAQSLIDEFL